MRRFQGLYSFQEVSAFNLRGIGVITCIAHEQYQHYLILIVSIEKDCASQVLLREVEKLLLRSYRRQCT